MKIAIIGGAGFIGSGLANRLLKEENDVLVIDNLKTGKRENLDQNNRLIFYQEDITNKRMVNWIFGYFKPDIVVHAAASYKDPDDWESDIKTNILGTVNVVNASRSIGMNRLIYFQTSLCYGLNPIEQPITFNHPLFSGGYSGGSSYAISKTAAEQYIELSGLDFISFRLANVYGERNLSGAIPTFFKRINKKLKCTIIDARRDFIYIDDVLDVVVKAVEGKGNKGYYHISTGMDYSIVEIFNLLRQRMNQDTEFEIIPVKEGDTSTILIDSTKTKEDFEWEPKTRIEEGIGNAISWYRNHDPEETFTHLKI